LSCTTPPLTKLSNGHRNIWTHTLHWLTLILYSAMRRWVKFNHSGLLHCMRCGLGVIWFWQM
jgi:hypothetical protein